MSITGRLMLAVVYTLKSKKLFHIAVMIIYN